MSIFHSKTDNSESQTHGNYDCKTLSQVPTQYSTEEVKPTPDETTERELGAGLSGRVLLSGEHRTHNAWTYTSKSNGSAKDRQRFSGLAVGCTKGVNSRQG
jgi:hypothetical protein